MYTLITMTIALLDGSCYRYSVRCISDSTPISMLMHYNLI